MKAETEAKTKAKTKIGFAGGAASCREAKKTWIHEKRGRGPGRLNASPLRERSESGRTLEGEDKESGKYERVASG